VNNTYYKQNKQHDDLPVEGLVILSDFSNFCELEGGIVIIFNDSAEAQSAAEEMRKYGDLDIAFNAALEGHAEEISIQKLVKFYMDESL
jgi:hypothetical protein|tara:strand:+ start:445 stop:711 length:267 start_codon:yes stop_codon:yes gene_type:complete